MPTTHPANQYRYLITQTNGVGMFALDFEKDMANGVIAAHGRDHIRHEISVAMLDSIKVL